MRLTMKQRQAVTAVTVQRYRNGSKKIKQQILDEIFETRGYCCGYCALCLAQSRTTGMAGRKKSDRGRRAPAAAAAEAQVL